MKELITGMFNSLGWAYWVEITTHNPKCIYYFGPFLTEKEALAAQGGYIEDLKSEGAEGIVVKIERCHPQQLTIFDEENESLDFKPIPAFSSQSY